MNERAASPHRLRPVLRETAAPRQHAELAAADDRARTSAPREHYWDSIRGLLMLLGVPYHAAMPYRSGQEWIVTSPQGSVFFTILSDAIHLFRMPVFFIVAGYFVAMMLVKREPGAWFRSRLLRLGVPLLTGLFLVVPVLNFACEFSHLSVPAAAASFRQQMASSGGYWVRHLWFIIVLLYFTAAAAFASARKPSLRIISLSAAIDARIAGALLPALVAAGLAIGLYELTSGWAFHAARLETNLLQQILRLDEALTYLPFFAAGLFLQRAPALRDAFMRPSLPIAAIAIATGIASLWFDAHAAPSTAKIVAGIAVLGIAQILLSAARTWFDRPNAAIDELVRASFVIYLVHMPIVIALVDLFLCVDAPVGVEVGAIIVATLALSYALFKLIERIAALDFLFNGILPRARPNICAG